MRSRSSPVYSLLTKDSLLRHRPSLDLSTETKSYIEDIRFHGDLANSARRNRLSRSEARHASLDLATTGQRCHALSEFNAAFAGESLSIERDSHGFSQVNCPSSSGLINLLATAESIGDYERVLRSSSHSGQ